MEETPTNGKFKVQIDGQFKWDQITKFARSVLLGACILATPYIRPQDHSGEAAILESLSKLAVAIDQQNQQTKQLVTALVEPEEEPTQANRPARAPKPALPIWQQRNQYAKEPYPKEPKE